MKEKNGTKLYTVSGMSCAACSSRVEKAVSGLPEVENCAVNLLTGDLRVEGSAPETEVIRAVTEAGYGCSPRNKKTDSPKAGTKEPENPHKKTVEELKRNFRISLVLILPLMWLSMGVSMWGWPAPGFLSGKPVSIGLAELLLSSAVLIVNRRFFINGFRGLFHKSPNMDTLVALGSGVSWLWSLICLFRMSGLLQESFPETAMQEAVHLLHSLYFESAAMILVFITLGKMLEARSKGKTADAVNGLKKLRPSMARIPDGKEIREIPAGDLKPGDPFILFPGDIVPADGIVQTGNSSLDESMLTGESIPVEKFPAGSGKTPQKANRVYAATINKTGRLVCICEKTGEETVLSQIIEMVTEASATKAPVSRLADRIAAIFVPTILVLALAVFFIWFFTGESLETAFSRGVSVLVISCPCALGLATPVAIMAGSGVGARNGILFKTALSLEMTGKIKTAVFDKTGTVTEGKPEVTAVFAVAGTEEAKLLRAAVSLEAASEHPLAAAILRYGAKKQIVPEGIREFLADGSSVSGMLGGEHLVAGGRLTMEKSGVPEKTLRELDCLVSEHAEKGETPVWFSSDKKLLGIIFCADQLRQSAIPACRELKEEGIRTVLLTGDSRKAAETVAKAAGIDTVYAEVLPGEKARIVSELQKTGSVLMVGDGINDAPALTAAEVGVAVATGTDIAIDAADVVLMKSDLLDVPAAVRLSRKTLRTIHQNLFWAFAYNVCCIPLAAGIFAKPFGISLNPMIGAACMSLSSLFVVTNALRLYRFQPRKIELPEMSCESRPELRKDEVKDMETELKINGMMCPHCEARVKKALEAVAGVAEATVSHEKGNALIKGTADREALIKAVTDAGYEVQ